MQNKILNTINKDETLEVRLYSAIKTELYFQTNSSFSTNKKKKTIDIKNHNEVLDMKCFLIF